MANLNLGGADWLLQIVLMVMLAATMVHAFRLERALGVLRRDRAADRPARRPGAQPEERPRVPDLAGRKGCRPSGAGRPGQGRPRSGRCRAGAVHVRIVRPVRVDRA